MLLKFFMKDKHVVYNINKKRMNLKAKTDNEMIDKRENDHLL